MIIFNIDMDTFQSRRGFSLVEVIVTMSLLAVMIVVSFDIFPYMQSFMVKQDQRLMAGVLAYSQIEDLRRIAHSVSFSDPSLNSGANNHTVNIAVPARYALNYTIANYAGGNPWPLDPKASNVDYKKVTVTCTTPSGYVATLIGAIANG